ncbi:RNA polymerase sigma factor [Nannocystis pusilla]|uniref:RNA polymerase sigma factor n=1 Tax=Nannocystis pusilla TaxID=889268 RepID=UPI003B82B061
MADASDSQLLTAWRGGDQAAGEALFARHFASIARFFRNKIHGDIEELIQRTFLGCLEGQQRFSGEGSFRGFLFGIARNVLYNQCGRTTATARRSTSTRCRCASWARRPARWWPRSRRSSCCSTPCSACRWPTSW